MAIERTFQNITKSKLREADQQSFLVNLGWSRGASWQELLRSKRVLIISEAGTGKTHECRAQCRSLWNAGEPAFFLELATLAAGDLRSMLDHEEEVRLNSWLASQSDVATFFLDSIDELKLSLGSFEQALKRLSKGITGQLGRTRIVITTRPIPFDEQLVRRLLPIPPLPATEASDDTFAQIAMRGRADEQKTDNDDGPNDYSTVALMPLSDTQIMEFAREQGVDDPSALLEDLQRRNAQEFARRPQDLIELCADWNDFKRIRTHREQVAANIRVKLRPREDRPELGKLSVDKAIDGASRLALAMSVTRRLTIRHSAETDIGGEDIALDPAIILSDWNADERKALLERPLFGFASYGRVRFHHRSVAEYLAAERIRTLRARGMSVRALKRLIFAQTKGKTIVRPSIRPVAAWLALVEDAVFELLRDHEPALLLTEGDPESLTLSQRSQALSAYVERYSRGGWRGLTVPHIQIHRFAAPELAREINRLWDSSIENPEVREILLHLIEVGRIEDCSNIAYETALDAGASRAERLAAIDAMSALSDPRLDLITAEIADGAELWPEELANGAAARLFPHHLTVPQLCQILARMKEKKRGGTLNWHLARLTTNAELDLSDLEALRDGLAGLVSTGLRWQDQWPHIVSDRAHLSGVLAATCVRGIEHGATEDWLRASVLALRMHPCHHEGDDNFKALKKLLSDMPASTNAGLFWAEDALIQSLHAVSDPWERLANITQPGTVEINRSRDWGWIKIALVDTDLSLADRSLLLEAAMLLAPSGEEWRDHIIGLKPLVADQLDLVSAIEERLKPSKREQKYESWERKQAKRKKQQERREAKNRASWLLFWHEVAERSDTAFSPERSDNTARNLWRAMSKDGEDSRASGWNRRFIEEHFDKPTADRLRQTLMDIWRSDRPTLTSERPDDEKSTYLVHWQLGLAAIYAEAEDPQWATKLTDEDALLAARYAPIELNGLPLWMEGLVETHPEAVDATLGNELSLELESEAGAQGHSMQLQNIGYAPDSVAAVFLPRLRAWLDTHGLIIGNGNNTQGAAQRLRQVVDMLLKHGDQETFAHLRTVAQRRLEEKVSKEVSFVWLPTLMRLDGSVGVDALEKRIRNVVPAQYSEAVIWFSVLFGDRQDAINLADPAFTPPLLLRLLRLAYRHVRPEDDVKHDGVYSPDSRDHAERARGEIVNAMYNAGGEEGWAAKLEMAGDPLCAHFKDHILSVAEEHWAKEIDSAAFNEAQAVALDSAGEAPATSNEAMFVIMVDRLDDIDDLLLRDVSPREAWAGIPDEKVMRREIARELDHNANGLYKIDQEGVTADEKETDIRLRSTASDHEAVIELKLTDNRSGRNLRDAIKIQLVNKYMAPKTRRSGCLMITLAKDRRWQHPDNGSLMGFSELVTFLREEAASIVEDLGDALQLHVHALDLRPRLPTEASRNDEECA